MATLFDGHTHVFNAGFLPVYGILRSKGLRHEDAEPTRAIIEAALERDWPSSREGMSESMPAGQRALSEMVDAEARGETPIAAGPDFIGRFVLLLPAEQLRSIEHILRDTPVQGGSESMTTASAAQLAPWLSASDDVAGLRVLADGILRNAAEAAGAIEAHESAFAAGRGKSAGGIVEWLMLLTRHESRIVAQFADFWRGAGTFAGRTHQMIDMVHHYQGHTVYGFVDDQHQRMRAVAANAALALIGFTAFEPWRADSLEIVQRAIQGGFCGVKFYPPNGYRPIGNTRKDIVRGPKPSVVNQRNMAFFEWCVREDVPVFAHCTPGGMESRKDAGKLSDPRGWRAVLESPGLQSLRLCLGHAGGQDGWLADFSAPGVAVWEGSYASKVVALCEEFPNVYCDFGYFDDALTEADAARFQARLVAAFASHPQRFPKRCCHGTDWHLVMVDGNAPTWPARMRALLTESTLAPSVDDVMYRNSLNFLNLDGFLARSVGSLSAHERAQIASLQALR